METALGLAYAGALVGGGYAIAFGGADCHRGGLCERAHIALTQGICAASWTALELIAPKRVTDGARRWSHWATEERNPLVQLFYVALFAVGLPIYYRDAAEYVPPTERAVILVAVGACLCLSAVLSTSDPGRLTPRNVAAHVGRYAYDGALFVEGRRCPTCRIPKPARSKHCRLCGVCVRRHDHHCVWINNCVGGGNYGRFLAFLLAHGALLTVGAHAVFLAFAGIARRDRLAEAYVLDAAGRPAPITPTRMVLYLLQTRPLLAGLFASLACVGVAVWAFLGYHVWLAATNTTANEASKRRAPPPQTRPGTAPGSRRMYDRGVLRNIVEAVRGE